MNSTEFKKVKASTATEVSVRVDLEDNAAALLGEQQTPSEFLGLLIQQKFFPDAIRFLSQALPNREATWWACLCARDVLGDDPRPEVVSVLENTEKWVYKPNDEHRLTIFSLAEKATFDVPASWAGMAAFWSGGNISPYEGATVQPAEDMNGKAVTGAVMLAAVSGDAAEIESRYQKYLGQGVDIACGGTGRNSDGNSNSMEQNGGQ